MLRLTVLFLALIKLSLSDFNISIIHFNDFHARFEQIDNTSNTCKNGNCIGGFSRLFHLATKLKNERPNSILLNAGDNFRGTLWYIVHKWNATQYFLNKLPLDALTLGNHEFDDGVEGVVPFMQRVKAPIVVSNIDATLEPTMKDLFKKSIIIERGGRKIGIIGAVTADTKLTSNPGKLLFLNESWSINSEADNLATSGIATIIVLSHCGYERDLEIARSSSKISVIVGGHTDTFLYTGAPSPGPDKVSGPYPTIVYNKESKKVLVVQASAYTKYLGNLTVLFDETGNLKEWWGNPIFLDQNIPTDPKIDEEIKVWKTEVEIQGKMVLGRSLFDLPNKPCRSEECLLGNFVTDAMVFAYTDKAVHEHFWSNASIAIIHAGGLRAGLQRGEITFNDLKTSFPFEDTINICQIKGRHLWKIFEKRFDDVHIKWPHVFQVSGLRVKVNTTLAEGARVTSIEARCVKCDTPIYETVNLESTYGVLAPTFLTDSKFDPLFNKYCENKVKGLLDSDVYAKYLKHRSPLFVEIESRIQIDS